MAEDRRPRCTEKVFSGARWDMNGHRCGHAALKGSAKCHLHDPEAKAARRDVAPAPAPEAPTLETAQRTHYWATLTWEPGKGPVVPMPYREGMGYITRAVAMATDGGLPRVEVRGVTRKKDGAPGGRSWQAGLDALRLLGEHGQPLLDALEASRG